MKHPTARRGLSLLLALLLTLTMAPTALLADEDDAAPEEPGEDAEVTLRLSCESWSTISPYGLLLEPNSDADQGARITAQLEPITPETQDMRISWSSADPKIASVEDEDNGRIAYIAGKSPGKTTVTVKAGELEPVEIEITVSGIKLLTTEVSLLENETKTLQEGVDYELYGRAASTEARLTASIVNNKSNVYALVENRTVTIEGRQAGDATVVLQMEAAGYVYKGEVAVAVEANEAVIEWTEGVSPSKPLKFSALEEKIKAACKEQIGGELTAVIGLTVSTAQGTLYLGYNSPDDTGAGVGSSVTYYVRSAARGPYIKDIVFVPNPSFTGEKARITFSGQGLGADNKQRTFKGRLEVTLEDAQTDVTLTAAHGQPLPLTATPFSKVCQEETGSPLSYVIFTLPPAAEGVLYRDWKSELDYGSRVSAMEQYSRKDLEQITFVPAQGFVGTVTIGYAGYSTTGTRYNGQLVIVVTRELDRGLQYNDYGAGYVSFDGGDFDDYSTAVTGKRMDFVSFTPPPASQGTLYRSWRSGRGTAVESGDTFGLKALDSVTFVAAEGFHGVVRVPFTGEDRNGVPFSGTVEIHIQSSGGGSRGDIYYTCAPGGFVKLALSDFNNLSMDQTGQRLHYITFQTLPDFNQGALYHNRTSTNGIGARVTTTTKYFQSATPYLANLSFWASEGFRSVEIPFTGCAVNGQTFTGLLSIDSGSSSGGSGQGAVSYTTTGRAPAAFSGGDFDSACRAATGSALHYLVFSLPSSAQGMLCFQQQTGGTSVSVGTGEQFYLSGERGLSKISFVPAYGFSGVSVIPFTGWAIDGRQFQGTVEVNVRAGATSGSTVRYATFGTPVQLSAADFQAVSGGSQPSAIRFDATPDQNAGRLYYQYVSPTKYSWQSNTTAAYSLAGDPALSNLTFIPKAGFTGTMAIPYTATCYDGTSYTGRLEITVQAPSVSASFTDLTGYSAQTKAAVDYLSSQGIVNGMQPGIYGPGLSIRRGDFCLMLYRAFRFDRGGTILSFADVPQDAYYAEAVNILSSLGIVNGTGTNRFQPNANISRQDAALMVQRTLRAAGMTADVPGQLSHADANQVTGYAQGAVTSLVQLGIYPTTDTGRLNPKGDLTRSDMAVLLHRTMTR